MESVQTSNKKPSEELSKAIIDWSDALLKTKPLADRIIELASNEGFTKEQTRELIEQALKKRELTDRQIRRVLPPELKNPAMIRAPKFADTVSANQVTSPKKSDIVSESKPKTTEEISFVLTKRTKIEQLIEMANTNLRIRKFHGIKFIVSNGEVEDFKNF